MTQSIQNIDLFKDSIYQPANNCIDRIDVKKHLSASTLKKKQKYMPSWDISEQYQLTLHSIKGLSCDINKSVEV